ncbi:hypothetical protein CPR19092_LGOLGGFK_01088 [Companilactobacillus paralimentarius]|uniref:hypothetical protein n=1 Tax=Companilactobacillus paralimentarius TaxID=83526 RepID=UPI0038508D9B
MENQDLDLIGKTVGNMPYKIGIVDQNGNLKNQFVAKASTNRIDIPEQMLSGSGSTGGSTGSNTGGSTGGTTGGNTGGGVAQLPSTINLFSGSAVGNILLSGPTPNYDNVGDGLLITLSNQTSAVQGVFGLGSNTVRMDLSSIGLKRIKVPKEKLIVNNSFDISDQLSQYIGKTVNGQTQINGMGSWDDISKDYSNYSFSFSILSFGGATINVLPNKTLSMNLIVNIQSKNSINSDVAKASLPIPVIQVNTYKN